MYVYAFIVAGTLISTQEDQPDSKVDTSLQRQCVGERAVCYFAVMVVHRKGKQTKMIK